jgi:hypothetical protein
MVYMPELDWLIDRGRLSLNLAESAAHVRHTRPIEAIGGAKPELSESIFAK